MHKFGFTKAVAAKYEKIIAEYKILKVLEEINGYKNSVEDEAEYLRSVAGKNPDGVLGKTDWLRSKVVCHPKVIRKDCYYKQLQEEGVELNPKMKARAKRLYATKMKEGEAIASG